MTNRPLLLGVLLVGVAGACQTPPSTPPSTSASAPPSFRHSCDRGKPHADGVHAAPSGAPEVSTAWVAQHHCSVKLVDVRTVDEVRASGHIPGAEVVPLRQLANTARAWNPKDPIVFICRSGRRSARAVDMLERQGFVHTSSMAGGMLLWRAQGLPTHDFSTSALGTDDKVASVVDVDTSAPQSLESLLTHVHIPRVRVASLLMQGSEACVDGRETEAVIGTPGGDAGELLLVFATLEHLTGKALTDAEVAHLMHARVEHFGRQYFHSDDHALHHLKEELHASDQLRDVVAPLDDDAFLAFLKMPPLAAQPVLLQHLTRPANVGCGHLKLASLHADDYQMRRGLVTQLLRTFYKELWRHPEHVEFRVLHGDHQETAIINVRHRRDVRASTNVAAVSPRMGPHSFFVNHPEVNRFIRNENAAVLFEDAPHLTADIDVHAFERELHRLAEHTLQQTVHHLAPTLPVVEVFVEGDDVEVVMPPSAAARMTQE